MLFFFRIHTLRIGSRTIPKIMWSNKNTHTHSVRARARAQQRTILHSTHRSHIFQTHHKPVRISKTQKMFPNCSRVRTAQTWIIDLTVVTSYNDTRIIRSLKILASIFYIIQQKNGSIFAKGEQVGGLVGVGALWPKLIHIKIFLWY